MTQSIFSFLAAHGAHNAEEEPKVALALLLLHMIEADGAVRRAETQRLKAILQRLGLSGQDIQHFLDTAGHTPVSQDQIAALVAIATSADLDTAARDIWDIALSDYELHQDEEMLAWRLSDLMGLSHGEALRSRNLALAAVA